MAFILYALVPLGLSANWPHRHPERRPAPGAGIEVAAADRPFLLGEYAVVTREIQARIEHEHLLFALKFMVVGAVLGLIFRSRTNKAEQDDASRLRSFSGILTLEMAIICWSAVAVSAIIDVRIFFNAALIREAGRWVRSLEERLTSGMVPGWETTLAGSEMWQSKAFPLLVADRQLLTWILYLVTLYLFVPRDLPGNPALQRELLKLAAGGLSICVLLFGLVGLSFHVGEGWLPWHVAVTASFAAGAAIWLTRWLAAVERQEAPSSA